MTVKSIGSEKSVSSLAPKKTDFTIYTFHDHPDHPLKSFSLIILFLLLNKVGRKEVPHVTYNEHIWT